jgi:hypothetical protein
MSTESDEESDSGEALWESIEVEGRLVGRQEWDSGGPGAGAGVVDVYLYRGAFYASDDVDNYGPFKTFVEAAAAVDLFYMTGGATKRIWVELTEDDARAVSERASNVAPDKSMPDSAVEK